jgi:hypothetical protein
MGHPQSGWLPGAGRGGTEGAKCTQNVPPPSARRPPAPSRAAPLFPHTLIQTAIQFMHTRRQPRYSLSAAAVRPRKSLLAACEIAERPNGEGPIFFVSTQGPRPLQTLTELGGALYVSGMCIGHPFCCIAWYLPDRCSKRSTRPPSSPSSTGHHGHCKPIQHVLLEGTQVPRAQGETDIKGDVETRQGAPMNPKGCT